VQQASNQAPERRTTLRIDRHARAALKGQQACVVWLTGLSGAGKSTIATLVESQLHGLGRHTCLLDGDELRRGLNSDLGFDAAARVENVRRVGHLARAMMDAGLIVLVALISPFRDDRRHARALVPEGHFVEVHVDAPLAVVEARDTKGLYARARQGALPDFTGISSPYEVPEHAEITLHTGNTTAADGAASVVQYLRERGLLSPAPGPVPG